MSSESAFSAATLYLVPDEKRFVKNPFTGETEPLSIPYREFFVLHQLIKIVGLEAAMKAASYLVFVANDLGLSAEQNERLHHVLEAIHSYQGPDNETDVVLLTYDLLSDRAISRDEAADLASDLLGRPIKSDAWRKRVDRFAEAHGLPKIEAYKRRRGEPDNVKLISPT